MRKRLMLFLALLLGAAAFGATVYKWVDEHGVTHYSDQAPPKQDAQKIETPTTPATEGTEAPSGDSWREREEEFQERHRARQLQFWKRNGETGGLQRSWLRSSEARVRRYLAALVRHLHCR